MPFPENQCPKPQAVLTKDKAIEIFKISLKRSSAEKPNASLLAREYGVNEKTIRDIWTGRTWRDETQPLAIDRKPRPPVKTGRPLGCKDTAPRRRKINGMKPKGVLDSHIINRSHTCAPERICLRTSDQVLRSITATWTSNPYVEADTGRTISIPCDPDHSLPEPKEKRLLPEPTGQWHHSPTLLAVSQLTSNPCLPKIKQPSVHDNPSSHIPTPHCPPPPAILTPSPANRIRSAGCADAAPGAPSDVQCGLLRAGGSLFPPQPFAPSCQPLTELPPLFCLPPQPARGAFPCVASPAAFPPVWPADLASWAGPPAASYPQPWTGNQPRQAACEDWASHLALGGLLLAALRQHNQTPAAIPPPPPPPPQRTRVKCRLPIRETETETETETEIETERAAPITAIKRIKQARLHDTVHSRATTRAGRDGQSDCAGTRAPSTGPGPAARRALRVPAGHPVVHLDPGRGRSAQPIARAQGSASISTKTWIP